MGACVCPVYAGGPSARAVQHEASYDSVFRRVVRGSSHNRSHLLMYKLTGLNDNKYNLITGTEYFNQQLMLSVESQILDYVRSSKEPVMYRVTPVFKGNELVARGVLMEAKSVESDGLSLCRYAPNVETGVKINYATGTATASSSSVSVRQNG